MPRFQQTNIRTLRVFSEAVAKQFQSTAQGDMATQFEKAEMQMDEACQEDDIDEYMEIVIQFGFVTMFVPRHDSTRSILF